MSLALYQMRNATSFGGSASEQTVTYRYRVPTTGWRILLPAFNSTVVDAEIGTAYYQNYVVRSDEADDDYTYLELNYSTSGSRGTISNKSDGDNIYLPAATVFEKPLETAPNYRVKWNYELYYNASLFAVAPALPAWHAGAITKADADGGQYVWAQDPPGDDWRKLADRTKPGVEAYYVPAVTVRFLYWHATKATVEAQLQSVATRNTPAETFGYTGAWLVTSVQVDEDGTKFRGTVEWTFADVWDTDLYDAS